MTTTHRRPGLRATIAAVAVTTALAATAGTAFAAGDPVGPEQARGAAVAEQQARQKAENPAPRARVAADPVTTPTFSMTAVDKQTSKLYLYFPDEAGGFEPRSLVDVTFEAFADVIDVDNDRDGRDDGTWYVRKDGTLSFSWIDDNLEYHSNDVGWGYDTYSTMLSPGNLGGAQEYDLIGVDKAGVLWVYLGYPDGAVTSRIRIGAGWDEYTQIAGQGDLTGDGRADIVARDKSGVLWLYKGTGDSKAPFAPRTEIGRGWNTYDRLLSVGDLDADGTSDLLARKPDGDLYRYSGTGTATSAVYEKPVKIGWGYNIYNLL